MPNSRKDGAVMHLCLSILVILFRKFLVCANMARVVDCRYMVGSSSPASFTCRDGPWAWAFSVTE